MDEQTFQQLFPITANKELASQMGVCVTTVVNRARKLGLEKDSDYLFQLRSQRGTLATNLMRERDAFPRGEKHYNWKGGKPWERFKDPQYQEWRNAVLERDNYVCQECHRQCKRHEKGLAAHHIKEYAQFPQLRYEVSNGLTLCRACHMKLHGKEFEVKMVSCACGCGTMIPNRDKFSGRPRKYVNHHAKREGKPKDETLIPCACGCGIMIKRIGARGTPIKYAPGHVTRQRWQEGTTPATFSQRISAARKRDTHKRKRNEKGQFT